MRRAQVHSGSRIAQNVFRFSPDTKPIEMLMYSELTPAAYMTGTLRLKLAQQFDGDRVSFVFVFQTAATIFLRLKSTFYLRLQLRHLLQVIWYRYIYSCFVPIFTNYYQTWTISTRS